jgi:hypothetical protein
MPSSDVDVEAGQAAEEFQPEPVAPSATTFDNPMPQVDTASIPDRKVTIFASGAVSGATALKPGTISITADDIKKAIGVGKDQYIPRLTNAKITHFFNPSMQRLGLRIKNSKTDKDIVENSAHARNPATQAVRKKLARCVIFSTTYGILIPFTLQMEGFTAVLPSVVQGNLNAPLVPLGNNISDEQAETLEKWRGLKTSDLTGKSTFHPPLF